MDSSPVIVDNATKFGRDLDPRAHFPGFPFDDEAGFGRRSDIRSHLDDLAARHPEFADHLLGSAWGEVPFSAGSLGRGSGRPSQERPPANGVFHGHPDEDARSRASGASSHGGEPEQQRPEAEPSPRDTVDAGQQRHGMEAPQQQRSARSMSAPPENRQDEPRFAPRVDLGPRQEAPRSPERPPRGDAGPAQAQRSTVRRIPIFVEGRDQPVIARDLDEADFPRAAREAEFPRRPSPPRFARPPPHHQPFDRQPAGWSSHFAEPFFEPPRRAGWASSPPPQPRFRHGQQQPPRGEGPRQACRGDAEPQQRRPRSEAQREQAPPEPGQRVRPRDPLEKVAAVQREVDALAEQVRQFPGDSRKDKRYVYLDEMLTRELIKLDDIDTEGRDNVRTARKQAIRSIQETIGLLESKAPLPGQRAPRDERTREPEPAGPEDRPAETSPEENREPEAVGPEAMETQEAAVPEEQKAIPLPPPSSPTKDSPAAEARPPPEATSTTPGAEQSAPSQPAQPEQVARETKSEPMDATPEQQAPQEQQPMEVRQSSPAKELQLGRDEQKESQALVAAEQQQEVQEAEQPATDKPKKEPPPVPAKPNRSPKKAKKAAKQQPEQQPVSETAIPLPAPGQSI